MKIDQKWLSATMAGLVLMTGFSLFATKSYAEETPVNPIPSQIVLNQTAVDGVPMVDGTSDNWPAIQSQAAVVMDMSTGTLVYAKNPNQTHYPASITKIMTALLALQNGQLNDTMTTSQTAVNQEPDKVYLVPGETEPLEKLLYGLLLISANDAAVVIAEHYGGSIQGFATMMNNEAKVLGATHTHFANPNGLPNPDHWTTAYDMSLITRAAMQYPEFRKIVSTKSYHWQGQQWQSELTNLNKMLYYYPGAIGVKTGFTSVAHNTLVVAATRNHETFLAVLMDAQSNYEIRQDAAQLLDHAFANYHTQTFLNRGSAVGTISTPEGSKVTLQAADDLVATVRNGHDLNVQTQLQKRSLTHDAKAGTTIGSIDVYEDNVKVASVPTVLSQSVVVDKTATSSSVLSDLRTHWLLSCILGLVILVAGTWFYRRRRHLPSQTWRTS